MVGKGLSAEGVKPDPRKIDSIRSSTKNLYLEANASQKAIGIALLLSIQEEHESEANNGQQQNWVEVSVNDCEKTHYSR